MWEGLQAIRKEIEESVNKVQDNEEIRDGFQLRFVGKSYAKFITGLPSETVLVPDNDWNTQENNKNSQNIFITGDNLDALKHLVNAYSGAIKMIYIDPPYNTGSDGFVYKDNFKFSNEELKQKLGFTDTELARLRALDGKCSHSAWLTFMLPRLILAKRLLSDDGVIFISIDDNEQANLKMICEEVFGFGNSDVMIWRKSGVGRDGKMKNTTTFRKDHEYIDVCFKKIVYLNKSFEKPNWENDYGNPDNDPRGCYKSGVISKKEEASNPNHQNYYTVVSPSGKKFARQFECSKEVFEQLDKDKRIYWGKNGDSVPAIKIFVEEEREVTTSSILDYKDMTTTTGSKELESIIKIDGLGLEMRPKPVSLIKKVLQIGTNESSLILDFFAGSSTTAHAVMQLNKEDGGNRKYIMVQLDEPVKEGSEAEKHGFKTIDEISRKRIQVAANQIGDRSGFKHYKLAKISDDLILNKIDNFDPAKPNLLFDDMLSPFAGDALGTNIAVSGLDTLLTTWIVDDGYPFNIDIKEYKFGNYVAYSPSGSRRLYLISDGWDSDATKDLLNKIGCNEISVQTIIIYNHSFNFTTLTELKNNLKSVLDDDKKIEIIERF